jgi:DEAD/DEAH box helicase domain-containing protein
MGPLPVSARLQEILQTRGITRLYAHQAQALAALDNGFDTVVATPTSSGKSLVYQLAMLAAVTEAPQVRGLFLYPLKALAQDQFNGFHRLAAGLNLDRPAAIYDGDTPAGDRRRIRQQPPTVVLTNPEMLHLSLLPHHETWADLWRGLRLVVVDEAHVYRGIVGSHMANLIQRLLRVAATYGGAPRFIFTSATIANPDQFCGRLCGRPVTAVTASGCGRPPSHLLMVNPNQGPIRMAVDLLRAALHRRLRTIVFTPSRKMAEIIAQVARSQSATMAQAISPYRAGYTPAERRDIERRLALGELLAVVSTSALELGIDIGDLDLCILVGYPGTRIATRQRAGRVGRRQKAAAVILIAGEDALDAYFLKHPQALWKGETERAVLNPLNPQILSQHLICAAAELPLRMAEPWLAVDGVAAAVDRLRREGHLRRRADAETLLARRKRPHRQVHLRTNSRPLPIMDAETGHLIGEVDRYRAPRDTHPGAVYLHRGTTYRIESLDLTAGKVSARRQRVGYTTRARTSGHTEIVSVSVERSIAGTHAQVHFGQLQVTDRVVAFERIRRSDGKKLGTEDLDLPPQVFETEGLWFCLAEGSLMALAGDPMGALHAAEHLLIALFPLLVLADRNDVGGLSTNFHPQTGSATIFIYDGIPGGAGLCREAFDRFEALVEKGVETVATCPCESGCPACIHSPKCGSGNDPLDKGGARRLLEGLLRTEPAGLSLSPSPAPTPASAPVMPARTARSPRFGVLDLETQRSAEEVGGWGRAHRMKISCAVLYDSERDADEVFWEDGIDRLLARMADLDLVIGFNLLDFDYRVLRPYLPTDWRPPKTLDILAEVQSSLGYRRSLAHLARETLGTAKTADGLTALRWWREGHLDQLAEYCRRDVALTRDLYCFGLREGHLLYRDPEGRKMEVPVDFAKPLNR